MRCTACLHGCCGNVENPFVVHLVLEVTRTCHSILKRHPCLVFLMFRKQQHQELPLCCSRFAQQVAGQTDAFQLQRNGYPVSSWRPSVSAVQLASSELLPVHQHSRTKTGFWRDGYSAWTSLRTSCGQFEPIPILFFVSAFRHSWMLFRAVDLSWCHTTPF